MKNTIPVFMVSSGRSGSAMMEKVFSVDPSVEVHHEYLCTHVQKIACLWEMRKISRSHALKELSLIYGPALFYCSAPIFIDSSNKLTWVISLLDELFPSCHFVHIVRDGRKVTSSYYHKLHDECYDNRSVRILRASFENKILLPPPEKKYYWPIPLPPNPDAQRFEKLDQYGRICWHWANINKRINQQLENVNKSRKLVVRLEDLVSNEDKVRELFSFIKLPYNGEAYRMLQRPHNVNKPEDKLLTSDQQAIFNAEAKDILELYGYGESPEYQMHYDC